MAYLEEEIVEEDLAKIRAIEGDKRKLEINRKTKNRLKELLINVCRENILTHQDKLQQKQEVKAKPYVVGDRVRLRLNDDQKKKLGGKKIAPRNTKPYIVLRVMREWTYLLVKVADKEKENAKLITRHFNELVPCKVYVPDVQDCYWIKLTTAEKDSTSQGLESRGPKENDK